MKHGKHHYRSKLTPNGTTRTPQSVANRSYRWPSHFSKHEPWLHSRMALYQQSSSESILRIILGSGQLRESARCGRGSDRSLPLSAGGDSEQPEPGGWGSLGYHLGPRAAGGGRAIIRVSGTRVTGRVPPLPLPATRAWTM
jgi:hypothetical protein